MYIHNVAMHNGKYYNWYKLAAVGHYIEFIIYTHSSTIHEIHVTVYTRARHMHARTHA